MSYVLTKCNCGEIVKVYVREDRVFKTGEPLGENICHLCGSKVKASINIETTKRD